MASAARTAEPRQRRNREDEILLESIKLFSEKGYSAASMQDLADVIGVLKGSLYHYFDSKEDLLFRIFHEAHLEAEALMVEVSDLEVEPEERLREYIRRSIEVILANVDRSTLYFRDWMQLAGERREILQRQRTQYKHFLRDLIQDVYDAKGWVATTDIRYTSSFIIGATNWVADWYRAGGKDSGAQVAADYTELSMAAIMGAAAPPTRKADRPAAKRKR